MEQKIITLGLKSREAFNTLQNHSIQDTLSTQGALIWREVKDYYSRDGSILLADPELILSSLIRQYPKHKELFEHVITEVKSKITDISTENVLHDIKEQHKESIALELMGALESKKDRKIAELMEQYQHWSNGVDLNRAGEFTPLKYEDIVQFSKDANGIIFLPKALNNQLKNKLTRKNHVVIFALTDIGKTTFTVNAVYGFARQGLKTLYIANEEPAERVYLKFLTRMANKDLDTVETILRNQGTIEDLIIPKLRDKVDLLLIDDTFGETKAKLQKIIEDYEPDVLVVDQIQNVASRAKSSIEHKELAAQMMRELAKKNNLLAVSVTQAADDSAGKVKLGKGDIYGSNVGIPGTADLMIGITAPDEMEDGPWRWLSFPKNKVSGVKDIIKVKFDFERNMVSA